MPEVVLEYDLPPAYGRTSLSLRIGEASFRIDEFGDGTDAFGDFVRAALTIAAGGYRSRISLDGEPYEWRIILQRGPALVYRETLHVEIRGFPDIFNHAADRDGELLFAADCDADEFARAVVRTADAVWAQVGPEEYIRRQRLAHFPLRGLTALKVALATEEAPDPPIADLPRGPGDNDA